MATVRNLGLFPRSWGCPLTEEQLAAKFPNYYATTGLNLYPLKMSKEAAMAMYWKVRQWTIRATAIEGEMSQTVEFTYTSTALSPRHLVCGDRGVERKMRIVAEVGDPEYLPTEWVEFSWEPHSFTPLIDGDGIRPQIIMIFYAADDGTFGGIGPGVDLLDPPWTPSQSPEKPHTEKIPLEFSGFSLQLPVFRQTGSPSGEGSTTVEYIRATDYWQYS